MAYPKTYNPCDDCQYNFSKNGQESNMCKICEFKQLLDKPTADVEEVRHGEWRRKNLWGERICECSECKALGSPMWKRCPVCEAKMDGGKNENM